VLKLDETVLVVIDVQGKLAQIMHERNRLFNSLEVLIRGAKLLGLPILLTEQVPEKLGSTVPEVRELLSDSEAMSKNSFSCLRDGVFRERLEALGRCNVILAGIETHVCVYQTSRDLLELGYRVEVVTDAVSSRSAENRSIGLTRMKSEGAYLTSVEMVLFELQEVATGERFRGLAKLIKDFGKGEQR
jgi:nicotinamidase-related amidase